MTKVTYVVVDKKNIPITAEMTSYEQACAVARNKRGYVKTMYRPVQAEAVKSVKEIIAEAKRKREEKA